MSFSIVLRIISKSPFFEILPNPEKNKALRGQTNVVNETFNFLL
ncbi:hypothetical protein C943_02009 [Mariniradius saccharolyticus AK6]|uniref:Uncharacterized protein n=1 Tax=Mariniradius saccharolyticus AK6 TaxID=1239962 RepID=M7XAS8_9BACT|nr:hypothetical protein C943_02009 [Mariniradius saccharolyticus AK6]